VPKVTGGKDAVIPMEEVMACPKTTCEFHPKDGRRPRKLEGEKVLVWGDHYAAVDTVLQLASIGKAVTIVTDRKEFASEVEVIHMYVFRKRFKQTDAEALMSKPFKHPVTIYESSRIEEIRKGEIVIVNRDFNESLIPCDHVVPCWTKPNTALYEECVKADLAVLNVGDSVKPRNLHAAVQEGALAGLMLDDRLFINSNGGLMDNIPPDIAGQLTR